LKILASDFDETIYYADKEEVNNKNIVAIRNFINRGNIFCIITGRNYTDLKMLLNELNIPYTYLICEDGAKIFNSMDFCIDTTYLDSEEIKTIIPILEQFACDYYLDDGYNRTENQKDCVKIVINCTDEQEKIKLVEIIKGKTNVHIYASRTHINIINHTVNKEKALKKLFNLENLDFNLLYTIGDNDNDYEMLKTFNGGVIKKHHHKLDELNKKEYDYLSDYIEELMLN